MSRPLLSINVNKYALVRNSRGRNEPDLCKAAAWCLAAGAHGITVHPRLDERHVRQADVPVMATWLAEHHPSVEFNVECEPDPGLIELVIATKPAQCTLVPVRPGEVTSDHGFDARDVERLIPVVQQLKEAGIRTSLFADCDAAVMADLAQTGADRVELYTGPYAWAWGTADQAKESARLFEAADAAVSVGLGLNAGHDLDRFNLVGLEGVEGLCEVSIGHAHVCRALEVGTPRSIQELLSALGW